MSSALVPRRDVMLACRQVLEQNSKSFALAARLLPAGSRDEAACVYAYCRRVDDAIDDVAPELQGAQLQRLIAELDALYAGELQQDPALLGFQAVVEARRLPKCYPLELLRGMAMDAEGTRYDTLDELLLYCHRVASVVGLMMCHAFGLTRDDALLPAAHLGIAMQLTNICRDVAEDYGMGRVYLPRTLLQAHGAPELCPAPGSVLPEDPQTIAAMQQVTRLLLAEADRYYLSADTGIVALPYRAGLAVRAARTLYAAIGDVVRAQDCDPRRGRAVVSKPKKLSLVAAACLAHVGHTFSYVHEHRGARSVRPPERELRYPEDVLA